MTTTNKIASKSEAARLRNVLLELLESGRYRVVDNSVHFGKDEIPVLSHLSSISVLNTKTRIWIEFKNKRLAKRLQAMIKEHAAGKAQGTDVGFVIEELLR